MPQLPQSVTTWFHQQFPQRDDEAETRRTHFMVVVAFGTLPLLLIGVGHEAYVGNPVGVVINGVMAVMNLVVIQLLRSGHGVWVGWPYVIFQLIVSNLAAAAVGGPDSSGFAGNVVVVTFAAIVLPRIGVPVVLAIVAILATLMFKFPQSTVVEFSNDMHVWSWMVCLTMASGMVAALVSVTESTLYRAREKSDELEAALDELQRTSVSRDFVQDVVSAIPDFVVVASPTGRIQMVNQAFSSRAGWHLDDLRDKPLVDLFVGLDGRMRSGEASLRTVDGTTIPVALSEGELPARGTGEPLTVWSATDIRSQHATQDALRQAHMRAQAASRAKSNFLANMSHELRTPLNAIIGYGELLADDIDDEEQRGDLEKIGVAARTLLDLINGVLDLSRVESGKVELELAETTVSEVVDDVINLVRPLAASRGLELHLDKIDREGPKIYVDQGKLKQVLTNLLTNAVKFTPEGAITLEVERWQRSGLEWLRIVVSDTGIGLAHDDLARIFEPFAQAGDQETSAYGGTGLGLSICSAFIEMMGGQLHVKSELGVGTRFVAEVPAAATTAIRATPTPSRPLPAAQPDQRTMLVVDDDPRFLELVERVVAAEGRQVVCTSSPARALEWAATNAADLVLVDVEMPAIDGWTFMVRLRNTPSASATIAVVSGRADAAVARALGAERFLAKPVSNADLRQLADELA